MSIPILPRLTALALAAVLLLSPANGSFRYAMPFLYTLPFLLSLCLLKEPVETGLLLFRRRT